jgi:hypothetical protein
VVIALQMANMGWKHHIRFIKDVSFVSACNAEFCNNLEAVYFCRGQNFIPFSKKCTYRGKMIRNHVVTLLTKCDSSITTTY